MPADVAEVGIPTELLERYRTEPPRYKSYPKSTEFGPIEASVVAAALAAGSGPLSLYVHIPFCEALCSFCRCHVEIEQKRAAGSGYVDALLAELDLVCARIAAGRRISQLVLGGGTPTFLLPEDMSRLVRGIRRKLPFLPGAEVAIEIHPRTVDADYVGTLADLGFNRYTLGVPDFDAEVLATVERPQPETVVRDVTALLRARGSFAIQFDVMYGLPRQDATSFQKSLDRVCELRPHRIAMLQYVHAPSKRPAQKVLEAAGIPDCALTAELFTLAERTLGAAGYQPIGTDHFALDGDELVLAARQGALQRNVMGYTSRARLDQIGIGVSAIGYGQGVYTQNLKDRDAWAARIAAGELPTGRGIALSPLDLQRRRLIMSLLCTFNVRWRGSETFDAEVERLRPLEADGLCTIVPGGVDVTPLGRHFIRNICEVFDTYLGSEPELRVGARG